MIVDDWCSKEGIEKREGLISRRAHLSVLHKHISKLIKYFHRTNRVVGCQEKILFETAFSHPSNLDIIKEAKEQQKKALISKVQYILKQKVAEWD